MCGAVNTSARANSDHLLGTRPSQLESRPNQSCTPVQCDVTPLLVRTSPNRRKIFPRKNASTAVSFQPSRRTRPDKKSPEPQALFPDPAKDTEQAKPHPGLDSNNILPHIDLDSALRTAREIARARKGVSASEQLAVDSPKPEPETAFGRALANAKRPDCRNAYASAGLLAIPLLIKDAVTDNGCTW